MFLFSLANVRKKLKRCAKLGGCIQKFYKFIINSILIKHSIILKLKTTQKKTLTYISFTKKSPR